MTGIDAARVLSLAAGVCCLGCGSLLGIEDLSGAGIAAGGAGGVDAGPGGNGAAGGGMGAGGAGGAGGSTGGGGPCSQVAPFARHVGGVGEQRELYAALVRDGSGEIAIAGTFEGTIEIDGEVAMAPAGPDVFVARLDGSGHIVGPIKVAGSSMDEHVRGVAVDHEGNVVVVGFFAGSMNFGDGQQAINPGGGYGIFVSKLDRDGKHLWSRSLSPAGGSVADLHVAVAASDIGVYVTGTANDAIDLGNGAQPSPGDPDIFAVRLDHDGGFVWGELYNDAAAHVQVADAIAVDGTGNVAIAGRIEGEVAISNGPVIGNATIPVNDAFVVVLDAVGGYVWSRMDGGPGFQAYYGVAFDPQGDLVVAGEFNGGPFVFSNSDRFDIPDPGTPSNAVVVKYSPTGQPKAVPWRVGYGDRTGAGPSPQIARAVAAGQTYVAFGGTFEEGLDIGAGSPLVQANAPAPGEPDAYVALLAAPFGEPPISLRLFGTGDAGVQDVHSVALDGCDSIVVSGSFEGTIAWQATGQLMSAGGRDLFVARVPFR